VRGQYQKATSKNVIPAEARLGEAWAGI